MIGVIIINWNRASYTLAALRSVVCSNLIPEIVIVVDNGSAESDLDLLRDGLKDFGFPVILLEQGVNLGFGKANNIGMAYARAQGANFFWLLNNDTVVTPLALERAMKLFASPRVGAVGFALVYDYDRHKVQALGGGVVNLRLGVSHHITRRSELSKLNYLTAASILLRADAIDQVGGFHPDIFLYWEDVELSLRIFHAGWDLAVASDAVIYHKESASSNSLGSQRQAMFTQGLSVVLREHSGLGVGYIALIHLSRALRKMLLGQFAESWSIMKVGLRI